MHQCRREVIRRKTPLLQALRKSPGVGPPFRTPRRPPCRCESARRYASTGSRGRTATISTQTTAPANNREGHRARSHLETSAHSTASLSTSVVSSSAFATMHGRKEAKTQFHDDLLRKQNQFRNPYIVFSRKDNHFQCGVVVRFVVLSVLRGFFQTCTCCSASFHQL